MTSKEALEKISWRYVNEPTFQEWCNTIKQDLERLEVLENVIEILKSYVDIHKNCITFDTITCFEKQKYELLKEVLKK